MYFVMLACCPLEGTDFVLFVLFSGTDESTLVFALVDSDFWLSACVELGLGWGEDDLLKLRALLRFCFTFSVLLLSQALARSFS